MILIITHPGDFHSFAVAEALRRRGAEVSVFYSTDFPTLQTASFLLDSHSHQWDVSGSDLEIKGRAPTTIWLRRAAPPMLPDYLDPADRQFARQECRAFLNCLIDEAGSQAFWVNPVSGATRANLKTLQLKVARQAGLLIPPTLCSNRPEDIRQFMSLHGGEVLYKAFYPMSWKRDDGVAALFSSLVREESLPEDSLLQAVPGIFQAVIPKAYEVRVTVMGQQLLATKIYSQDVPSAQVDWRAALEPILLEPVELPDSVAKSCLQVMKALGIVFGCFDLIVTPKHEYVFLEVNEMGAFLWIEAQIPEIRLLDTFCEFLLARSPHFHGRAVANSIQLEDVEQAALQAMGEAKVSHVLKEADTIYDDA